MKLVAPVKFDSALGFGDRSIGILYRAMTPATFIMLRRLQLRARSTQMFERPAHVRLIGPGRNVECANCNKTDDHDFCFHSRM